MNDFAQIDVPVGEDWYFEIVTGLLEYELIVESGWNLLSVPIEPVDAAVADLFGASIDGPAWEWNGLVEHYDEASSVHAKRAVWVHRGEATSTSVVVRGTVPSAAADWAAGWQMGGVVGGPPFSPVPRPLVTSPAGAVTASLYRWNAAGGCYARLTGPIPCGIGVWLFLNQAATVQLGQ